MKCHQTNTPLLCFFKLRNKRHLSYDTNKCANDYFLKQNGYCKVCDLLRFNKSLEVKLQCNGDNEV